MNAKEVASLVGDWGYEVSGSSGSSLGAFWELVAVAHINLPTQNTLHTILNAMSLACAKSSIGSMQVGFLMALVGGPVR